MKILFSPSEDKYPICEDSAHWHSYKHFCETLKGLDSAIEISQKTIKCGNNDFVVGKQEQNLAFVERLLFGSELSGLRKQVISDYVRFLSTESKSEISRILGTKKLDILHICISLSPIIEAIWLYSGVAFKALDIGSLPKNSVHFLYDSVIIFSNLFGAIRAGDKIPYYKLKQGQRFYDNDIFSLYHGFGRCLDRLAKSCDEVLDLRAEVYIKAYPLSIPHTKVEFYHQNKKTTHYSKHYRGLLLREMALRGGFEEEVFPIREIKNGNMVRIIAYNV